MKETTHKGKMVIADNDRAALIAGLKAGLGLTQSANIIMMPVKDLSAILKQDKDFYKECQEAVKYAAKVMLVLSNQYLKDKQFTKWKENNQYIKLFVSNINLWESYCVKDDVTAFKAAEAYVITNDKQEAATICGMTLREYNYFLLKHPKVKQLIQVMVNI